MFKNRLKSLVEAKRDTESIIEMAKHIGISRDSLYKLLNADRNPSADVAKKLAQYFGVTVDYLLSETEDDEMVIINTGNLAAHNSRISVGEALSQQEQELIRLFRSLPVKDQVQLLSELYKKEEA